MSRRDGVPAERVPDPVTPALVRGVRFTPTKFADGYDQDEVDDLLDLVVDALEGRAVLTARDVEAVRFQATKFRTGYAQNEVDVFLDRIADTLRLRAETGPGTAPAATADPGHGTDVPAWGSIEPAAPAWGTPESTFDALADEVERARFQATKFRAGYDQEEVDDFLDVVVATLRHRGPGRPPLTWQEVAERTFFPTRFREGYEPADVDALLERVARELKGRTHQ